MQNMFSFVFIFNAISSLAKGLLVILYHALPYQSTQDKRLEKKKELGSALYFIYLQPEKWFMVWQDVTSITAYFKSRGALKKKKKQTLPYIKIV